MPMMTTPRLMLITIIGTLAFLGLAIFGWGGFAASFSHPPLIALAITLLVLSGVAVFSGGNLSPGVREDRANRWVIVAFGLIGLLDAYLPAYTDRKEFWTLDGDAIRWLGVVLFAAGGALRIWPVFVLGRRFSGVGSHSARTYAGHDWSLSRHPPPELFGSACQFAGLGARFSFGPRLAAHGASYTAARRACGRKVTALAVRRRVRGLSHPHVTTDPWVV
jgi:hypothetical protein